MSSDSSLPASRRASGQIISDLPESGDIRTSPRRPYKCIQRIAVCQDFAFPPEEAFQPIRCNGISMGGISFFYPTAPTFSKCVIELGSLGIFMLAEVVSTLETISGNGWLVACEFRGRILDRDMSHLTSRPEPAR